MLVAEREGTIDNHQEVRPAMSVGRRGTMPGIAGSRDVVLGLRQLGMIAGVLLRAGIARKARRRNIIVATPAVRAIGVGRKVLML